MQRIRRLTDNEAMLAQEVFGQSIDLNSVRFLFMPWPFVRAFVAGSWFGRSWIIWPARNHADDFTHKPLTTQAVFIHELVHVWQAQEGLNLLLAKIRAGDSAESYRYPVHDHCHWDALNIEQQAMVVEHRFRLSRGLKVPAEQAFYDRVCPVAFSLNDKNFV